MKKDLPNLEKRGSYNNIEINNGMMVYPVLSLKRCHGVSLARYFYGDGTFADGRSAG